MITTLNKPINILKIIPSEALPRSWEMVSNSTIVEDRQTKSIRSFYNLLEIIGAEYDSGYDRCNLLQQEFFCIDYETGNCKYNQTYEFMEDVIYANDDLVYNPFESIHSKYENVIAIVQPALAYQTMSEKTLQKYPLKMIIGINQVWKEPEYKIYGSTQNGDFKQINTIINGATAFAQWEFIAKDYLLLHEQSAEENIATFIIYNFRTQQLKSYDIDVNPIEKQLFSVINTSDIDGKIKLYFKEEHSKNERGVINIYLKILNLNDLNVEDIGELKQIKFDQISRLSKRSRYIAINPLTTMIGVVDIFKKRLQIFDSMLKDVIFEHEFDYKVPQSLEEIRTFTLFWIKKDILFLMLGIEEYTSDIEYGWQTNRECKLYAICDIRNDESRIEILNHCLNSIDHLVMEILDFIRFDVCDVILDKYLESESPIAYAMRIDHLITDDGHGIFGLGARYQHNYYAIE